MIVFKKSQFPVQIQSVLRWSSNQSLILIFHCFSKEERTFRRPCRSALNVSHRVVFRFRSLECNAPDICRRVGSYFSNARAIRAPITRERDYDVTRPPPPPLRDNKIQRLRPVRGIILVYSIQPW